MQRIKFFVTLGLICIFGASGLLFAEPASHDASAWPVIPTEERFSELDEPYFLIIQDTNPWGRNDIQTYLGEQEYDYDLINVNSIANTDFSEYTVVMITSAQSTQFYTTLSNNMDQFDDYISGGGWLEFHGATQGGSWELWDGTANFFATSPTNTVEDDEHPIVQSINATITGTSASHDYLTDLPDDANIIMENAIGEPVLVEYAYGAGNVLISTQTLEFYANQAGAANCGPIMFDMIDYAAEFGGVPPDGTLEGIVTDSETDDPIEGAEVVSGRSTDTTDVDGYYYLAEVSSGEGRRVRINHLYYFPYEVDTLVLDVGENEIDFAIDILSADITGIITDELTEELLMGVTVLCINAETGDIYREVTTNDTGGYVAPALHHGVTYRVVASMTGYAPSDTLDITIDWEREYTEDFELTPIFERTVRQLQQEQDPETWVTCTGVVTQGTNVTNTENTELYVQDESGYGILVWDEDAWDPENDIMRGDEIIVIGYLLEEDDVTMITIPDIEVIGNDNPMPEPRVEGTGDMGTSGSREGTWAQMSGQINRDPPGEGDYTLIVNDGSGQCEVKIFGTTGIDLTGMAANDWGTFTGIIGLSRQGLRLIPNAQEDATRIAIDPPSDLAAEHQTVQGDPLQVEVILTWSHEHLDEWLRFKIYRDGEHVGNTQQNTWSEKIENPNPGEFETYTFVYTVTAVYDEGETEESNEVEVIWSTSVKDRPFSGVPTEWALEAVYPNPFNPTLHVVLGVPQRSNVTVEIMDILGRRVAVLHQGELSAAYHRVGWNATGHPTGLYFLRVTSSTGFNQISKVMFIK